MPGPRVVLVRLAMFFMCSVLLAAQNPATPRAGAATVPAAGGVPGGIHAVETLDGPWRFQIGDDPRWADPAFDDSAWTPVTIAKPLSDQGIDPYTGYGWYRLRLSAQQLSQLQDLSGGTPIDLLLTGNSAGQLAVYLNGVESGHTRGMTENPSMYQSPPFITHLPSPDAKGGWTVAIRTWAGDGETIHRGLILNVELGNGPEIGAELPLLVGRQWSERVIPAMVLTFLFLSVAVLGFALYVAQRHHSEYLWLALMCLSVAAGGVADAVFGLGRMPLPAYRFLTVTSGHVFMAVTLEFILRFTASPSRRTVRIVQIGVMLLPFVYLLRVQQIYEVLSVAAQVMFCALVCILLFRAWRRGRREAGVMLAPFFLAATAGSTDTVLIFAANQHWIPEEFANYHLYLGPIQFGISTVAYAIFLTSLIAVILYRFVRVSQDEQRSEAEVAAARSVQSLLIPTQLPSNRHFVLESAYLPVNGVGGDFFQVLPQKDDSLLIVVGDVSGKGLQAAMNSSTIVGALRNELSHDPGTILEHLNHVSDWRGVLAGRRARTGRGAMLCNVSLRQDLP